MFKIRLDSTGIMRHVGLRWVPTDMSVFDASPFRHVGLRWSMSKSPNRHVGLRWVSDMSPIIIICCWTQYIWVSLLSKLDANLVTNKTWVEHNNFSSTHVHREYIHIRLYLNTSKHNTIYSMTVELALAWTCTIIDHIHLKT